MTPPRTERLELRIDEDLKAWLVKEAVRVCPPWRRRPSVSDVVHTALAEYRERNEGKRRKKA